ncbi:hypothetical protein C6500_03150 [Candidatus Poribacteria bacterium]|nr:MAG: hypothetical protein C6500_03150 [Candidatus Poribacteria bacterium]
MKNPKTIAIVFYLTFLMFSNIGASAEAKPVNIIIILDTSDRISDEKHPGQIERDKEIIEEIVTEFEKVTKQHILASEKLEYQDRLTIAIPNQPGVPPVPRQIMKDLAIADKNRDSHRSLAGINADVENRKQVFLNTLDTLYEFVRQHRHTGSDIWEWFKYEAESYFSESHQNIIICISDGYLIFDNIIEDMRIPRTYMRVKELRDDPQWEQKIQGGEGLLTIGQDFSRYNIDFLMSEIQLQTDENKVPYQKDFQIITLYWEVWLKAMKIKSTNFGKVGHPVGQKIKNLIEQG